MLFTLQLPTKVYFGEKQIKNLPLELNGYNKVLILYGGGSIKKNGLFFEVTTILDSLNIPYVEYGGVEPNPRYKSVVEAADLCIKENVDLILAVGGGSVIDCAKSIAMQVKNPSITWEFFKNPFPITDALPIGAILTIAATGSESNVNTVITNNDTNEKIGYSSPLLRPKFAILDPINTITVPRNHTVYGIVDTIAHLLEQFFTVKSEEDPIVEYMISRAEYLIKRTIELAPKLLNDLENVKLREQLMYYAYEALNGEYGAKIGGDWASHVIEHSLSAVYDIAHGAGLAIVFPQWIEHASHINPKRVLRLAQNVFGKEHVGDASDSLKSFFRTIGAPVSLREAGIENASVSDMLKAVYARDTEIGKYVKLEKEDVEHILEKCL